MIQFPIWYFVVGGKRDDLMFCILILQVPPYFTFQALWQWWKPFKYYVLSGFFPLRGGGEGVPPNSAMFFFAKIIFRLGGAKGHFFICARMLVCAQMRFWMCCCKFLSTKSLRANIFRKKVTGVSWWASSPCTVQVAPTSPSTPIDRSGW